MEFVAEFVPFKWIWSSGLINRCMEDPLRRLAFLWSKLSTKDLNTSSIALQFVKKKHGSRLSGALIDSEEYFFWMRMNFCTCINLARHEYFCSGPSAPCALMIALFLSHFLFHKVFRNFFCFPIFVLIVLGSCIGKRTDLFLTKVRENRLDNKWFNLKWLAPWILDFVSVQNVIESGHRPPPTTLKAYMCLSHTN